MDVEINVLEAKEAKRLDENEKAQREFQEVEEEFRKHRRTQRTDIRLELDEDAIAASPGRFQLLFDASGVADNDSASARVSPADASGDNDDDSSAASAPASALKLSSDSAAEQVSPASMLGSPLEQAKQLQMPSNEDQPTKESSAEGAAGHGINENTVSPGFSYSDIKTFEQFKVAYEDQASGVFKILVYEGCNWTSQE